MSAEAWKNRITAVLLYAVLFVVSAPCAYTAEVLDSKLLQEIFPSSLRVTDKGSVVGVSFRVADCPCYALTDNKSIVRYIFVFPTEEERKPRKPTPKTQAAAKQLAAFLSQGYGTAELTPFSVQECGYVISLIPPSQSRTYIYDDSFLGMQTSKLISQLIRQKGIFYRCDGGELSIKMSGTSAENNYSYVSFPLFKSNADVIGFVPGRYTRRSDEKIVASAVTLLDLSTPYDPSDYPRYSSKLKDVRSLTGATKCIGMSYEWAMVSYRNRYYIGSESDLKDFIRNKKRGGNAGKFDFPQQSDSMPSIEADGIAQGAPAGKGDGGGKITIEQICDFFHCSPPIVQDDCACLLVGNCRVVIPLPHKEGTDVPSLLRLPVRYVCIHTPAKEDRERLLSQYAELMSFMLTAADFPPAKIADHPSDKTIKFLFFPTGIAPNADLEDKVQALLNADDFPDTKVHAWPEKNRAGKDIPDEWKKLATLLPEARDNAKPLTPDAALKDYMDYLLRLMK